MKRYLVLGVLMALALTAQAQGQIEISAVEGFNLKVIGRPGPNVLEVKPAPAIHNWFAGKFVNLPVGQPVEIRVKMAGCDTPGNVADTAKWAGLRPVATVADPERYETYEWYRRDGQGRWVSGDPFKQGAARLAGTDATPAQAVVPAPLAAQGLSADGAFWSPWFEIDGGLNDTTTRTFTFILRPTAAEMTVAMHVPYLLAYERELVARLQAARLPGVFVDVLGRSADGRPLYMIRVDDPASPAALQITLPEEQNLYLRTRNRQTWKVTDAVPTVRLASEPGRPWGEKRLMFLDAREHPSEHAGSWAVLGALKTLVADTPEARRLRRGATWLLLPVYDPDGVADGLFDPRTDGGLIDQSMTPTAALPETLAYYSYLRAFANAGWHFAVAATFYGLECNEGQTVICPFAWVADKEHVTAFNVAWFARLRAAGLPTGPEVPQGQGFMPFRLSGGCSSRYKALALTFQINDRYPDRRLHLAELEWLGSDYVLAVTGWMAQPEGAAVMAEVRENQLKRRIELERWAYREPSMVLLDRPTLFEMVSQGY